MEWVLYTKPALAEQGVKVGGQSLRSLSVGPLQGG